MSKLRIAFLRTVLEPENLTRALERAIEKTASVKTGSQESALKKKISDLLAAGAFPRIEAVYKLVKHARYNTAWRDDSDMTRAFLARGAQPVIDNVNILLTAIEAKMEDTALALIDAGALDKTAYCSKETFLTHACAGGMGRLVGKLIDLGADVNAFNSTLCSSPLRSAAHNEMYGTIRQLIRAGATAEWEKSEKYGLFQILDKKPDTAEKRNILELLTTGAENIFSRPLDKPVTAAPIPTFKKQPFNRAHRA